MNYRVTNISATLLKISSVYSYTRLTKDLRIRAMCFYTSRIMLARLLESALYFSVNVFSARVCRAGHFLHFPVFLRFRVLFRSGDRAMRNHAVTSRSVFKHPLNSSPAKYEVYMRRFVLFSFSSNTMVREGSHSNMFHKEKNPSASRNYFYFHRQ